MNEKYFYGYEVSKYGQQNGYVDYATFKKTLGNCVLCNSIINLIDWDNTEVHNPHEEEEGSNEIFQWYIVDSTNHAMTLLDEYNMIYLYDEENDILIWGIDHFGTGWDYVLTNIKLIEEEENND